jgi:hypothetical protein
MNLYKILPYQVFDMSDHDGEFLLLAEVVHLQLNFASTVVTGFGFIWRNRVRDRGREGGRKSDREGNKEGGGL